LFLIIYFLSVEIKELGNFDNYGNIIFEVLPLS